MDILERQKGKRCLEEREYQSEESISNSSFFPITYTTYPTYLQ
jgi:hypothetical protein